MKVSIAEYLDKWSNKLKNEMFFSYIYYTRKLYQGTPKKIAGAEGS